MPSPIFFPAYSKLLVEHADNWRGDVAAQDPELFPLLDQRVARKRLDIIAVLGFIKFLQGDGAEHGSTPKVECRGKKLVF